MLVYKKRRVYVHTCVLDFSKIRKNNVCFFLIQCGSSHQVIKLDLDTEVTFYEAALAAWNKAAVAAPVGHL